MNLPYRLSDKIAPFADLSFHKTLACTLRMRPMFYP